MMDTPKKQYLTFWRSLATDLGEGKPLLKTLKDISAKMGDSAVAAAIAPMCDDICNGGHFANAMARQSDTFPEVMVTMVRAGEAGGILEVIASRVADAIAADVFSVPGAVPAPERAASRYWRALHVLLTSGVPALSSLDLAARVAADDTLREATETVNRAILEGRTMSSAMADLPEVFDPRICDAIGRAESLCTLDTEMQRIADAVESGDLDSLAPPVEPSTETKQTPAVIQYISRMLVKALEERASDIHIEPRGRGGRVRVRVDGILHEAEPPPEEMFAAVVNRVKVMSALNIAERRLPQDGRIQMRVQGEETDIRVSTVPSIHGERVTMRILDRRQTLIGLQEAVPVADDREKVRALARLANGVVIVNGPAGSGKTTLLYAMLNEINQPQRAIFTIEDPVEYLFDGLTQIPLRPAIGLTFPCLMRSVLRQAPDVIMIGEIRDLETAEMCMRAGLTGHLLFTTLHTNTTTGTIGRLLDIGIEPFLVNAAVEGIASQRLVRVLCPQCKRTAEPALHSLPPAAVEMVKSVGDAEFCAPVGCDNCNGTGYRGRRAIHEILVMDDQLRQLIAAGHDLCDIRKAAVESGMRTLLASGLTAATQGVTSVEEVFRVVPLRAD